MDNLIYFQDLFESIPDYRNLVLVIFLIQNVKKLLLEAGFSERDIIRLNLEFEDILIGEYENYLDFVEDQEESILEKLLNK